MPGKIRISNHLDDIVQMTGEGIQAPHEHFGYYDSPAMYAVEPPAYIEPVPSGFEPIPTTPEIMFAPEPVQEEPEPEVTYDSCLMTPELFQFIMENLTLFKFPEEPMEIGETAEIQQIMHDMGHIPSPFDFPGIEAKIEIEQAIMDIQNQVVDPFMI